MTLKRTIKRDHLESRYDASSIGFSRTVAPTCDRPATFGRVPRGACVTNVKLARRSGVEKGSVLTTVEFTFEQHDFLAKPRRRQLHLLPSRQFSDAGVVIASCVQLRPYINNQRHADRGTIFWLVYNLNRVPIRKEKRTLPVPFYNLAEAAVLSQAASGFYRLARSLGQLDRTIGRWQFIDGHRLGFIHRENINIHHRTPKDVQSLREQLRCGSASTPPKADNTCRQASQSDGAIKVFREKLENQGPARNVVDLKENLGIASNSLKIAEYSRRKFQGHRRRRSVTDIQMEANCLVGKRICEFQFSHDGALIRQWIGGKTNG